MSAKSEFSVPVLYEDNHLLVVVKPVNMPSQADESGDLDLLSLLKDDIKRIYAKPGNVYLGLVHRLDRPVGGVMVFAKTSKAASRLAESVRSRRFDKTYAAIVHGNPGELQGTLIHHLVKDPKSNTVSSVAPKTPGAKEAVLDYRVTATDGKLSLLKIKLHTGRPHQIRVQFASIGCPLYGDQKYGKDRNSPGQQIALWAVQLSFEHPISRQTLSFSSKPPSNMPWTTWPDS